MSKFFLLIVLCFIFLTGCVKEEKFVESDYYGRWKVALVRLNGQKVNRPLANVVISSNETVYYIDEDHDGSFSGDGEKKVRGYNFLQARRIEYSSTTQIIATWTADTGDMYEWTLYKM